MSKEVVGNQGGKINFTLRMAITEHSFMPSVYCVKLKSLYLFLSCGASLGIKFFLGQKVPIRQIRIARLHNWDSILDAPR